MEVPYNQARPVWVDDEHFDISYHVRLTSLPRPGDDDQLAALMSRLQSLALDRARPLWEMWFVDGLADDHVGMIIKTHHALGDGIANVDLALALVDLEPDPPADDPVPGWTPQPAPSPNDLLAEAVREQMARPGRIARSMLDVDARPASGDRRRHERGPYGRQLPRETAAGAVERPGQPSPAMGHRVGAAGGCARRFANATT